MPKNTGKSEKVGRAIYRNPTSQAVLFSSGSLGF
jgi:hypothetical protein